MYIAYTLLHYLYDHIHDVLLSSAFFRPPLGRQRTEAPRNSFTRLSKSSRFSSRICRACHGSVSSRGGGRPARFRARSTWREDTLKARTKYTSTDTYYIYI